MDTKTSKKISTFAVATLGCKVNQYESAALISELERSGLSYVSFKSHADCYVINTCTITASTDYQSRQLIRRAIRQNPEATVIATGCYAEVNATAIRQIPGVTIIAGNKAKGGLVDMLMNPMRGDFKDEEGWQHYFPPPALLPGRTRATLKIEDGCESFCHYCIVPYARGPVRSLPPADVIGRLKSIEQAGLKEVTLTGIHLGAYGKDLHPTCNLDELLGEIFSLSLGLRIRLSSIEPLEVSDRLVSLITQESKFCSHLHLPIQSGDDEILRRMNRKYDHKFIRELIHTLTATCPDLAIGVDIMVGFPGESESSFAKTYSLLTELPIAYLHVFPYSRRPGTPAAAFQGQVSEEEKRKRSQALRILDRKKRIHFMSRFYRKPIEIIVEQRRDGKTGLIKGISSNYLPVIVANLSEKDANTLKTVIPIGIREGMLLAEAG